MLVWVKMKGMVRLLILMYYSIFEGNSLCVLKEEFWQYMKWFYDYGYYMMILEEVYLMLMEDRELCEKCVLIIFDDGYIDNVKEVYLILKKYKMKVIIFMIGNFIGYRNYLIEK